MVLINCDYLIRNLNSGVIQRENDMRKLEKGHFGSAVSDFTINPSRTLMTWSMMRAMRSNNANSDFVSSVGEQVKDRLGPPSVRPSYLSVRHYSYLEVIHKRTSFKASWMIAYFRDGKYCMEFNEFILVNQVLHIPPPPLPPKYVNIGMSDYR